MNNANDAKPPVWYWVIAGVALVWMLFGVMAWVSDLMMDEAALAQMSEAQRQLYEARPQWIFVLYAVAIFTGFAGAIALLLRKAWAVPAFAVSLIAVVVQFGYVFFGLRAIERLGAAQVLPFPLLIFAIGAFLLWFSMRARGKGWLR